MLHEWSFRIKFMNRALISYKMITSVRFCLSYDRLKLDFSAFKMDNISRRRRIVDTDVVDDVTSTRQKVFTRAVIRFVWHEVIHLKTATSCDELHAWQPVNLYAVDVLLNENMTCSG